MKYLALGNLYRTYIWMAKTAGHLQSVVLFLIRLAWGWQLLESGHGHLSDVAGTAKNFADWGVPFPTVSVYGAGSVEVLGGFFLMLGLLSRLISIPLIVNFCVAYLTASRDTVKHLLTQNPDAFINDAAFPFLVTSLLILAFGPGKFSVDFLAKRYLEPRCGRENPLHPL